MNRQRTNSRKDRRAGTSTVELAICLPTLVFICIAAIQASDTLFLKQTTHISAYETIRVAIQHQSTNTEALAAGQQILTARNIVGATTTLDPLDVALVNRGEAIIVTVSAPCEGNTVFPSWLYEGHDVSATVKMIKE